MQLRNRKNCLVLWVPFHFPWGHVCPPVEASPGSFSQCTQQSPVWVSVRQWQKLAAGISQLPWFCTGTVIKEIAEFCAHLQDWKFCPAWPCSEQGCPVCWFYNRRNPKACLVFWQFTDFLIFFSTNLVMVFENPFSSCRSKTTCINISLKHARSHVLKANVAMLEMWVPEAFQQWLSEAGYILVTAAGSQRDGLWFGGPWCCFVKNVK